MTNTSQATRPFAHCHSHTSQSQLCKVGVVLCFLGRGFPSCGAGHWKRTVLDYWPPLLDCTRKGLRTRGNSSHPISTESRQTDFDLWAPAVTRNHVPCVVWLSRMCNVILLISHTWGNEYKKETECFLKTGTIYTTIECAVANHSCSRI